MAASPVDMSLTPRPKIDILKTVVDTFQTTKFEKCGLTATGTVPVSNSSLAVHGDEGFHDR